MKIEDGLRGYQIRAINTCYHGWRNGLQRLMLCAPTGAGKTHVAQAIIRHLTGKGKRCNFVVDRTVLLDQTSTSFAAAGIPHGVISGGKTFSTNSLCRILSVQSMRSRAIDVTGDDLTIIDEAHVMHRHLVEQMEIGSRWLGLSATPFAKGLGDIYDAVVNVTTTNALVDDKWLSPVTIYCGTAIEAGRRMSSGEYDLHENATNAMLVVGDIIGEWEALTMKHFGRHVKTVVFANTVSDAEGMAEKFREAGHEFRSVSYMQSAWEKQDAIEAHRRGDIIGLISCEMLTRGYDVPDIECVIDAHPWRRAVSQIIQQYGRGMRTAPHKDKCLILDPAQNCLRHGARIFEFWRDGIDELVPRDNVAGEAEPGREALCPDCGYVILGPPPCEQCGWKPPPMVSSGGGGVKVVDGKMVPLDHGDDRLHVAQIGRTEYEMPPPAQGWRELCRHAQDAGKDAISGQRWCQANYRKFYGEFRRARFDSNGLYPEPSPNLRKALDHSKDLYIKRRKRESARSREAKRGL